MAQKYEFFVSSGAPTPANKAARSHAMKTALELRSRTRSGETEPRTGPTSSERTVRLKDGLKGKFRLTTDASSKAKSKKAQFKPKRDVGKTLEYAGSDQSGTEQSALSSPALTGQHEREGLIPSSSPVREICSLGSEYIDPFGTLPIPGSRMIDALVKHLMVHFDITTTSVPMAKTWFGGFAMTEPLLMRVTLSMAATSCALSYPSISPMLREEGWRLKGEAIQDINAKIQGNDVSEVEIVGISYLANTAALDGNFEEADMHLRGMERLIELRGGVETIQQYQIGRFVNWADIHVAAWYGRRALLPLHHGIEKAVLPLAVLEEADTPCLAHLADLGPDSEIVTTVLLFMRQRIAATKLGADDPTSLQSVRTILNVTDICILERIEEEPVTSEQHCIKVLLLACHLFLYAGLRDMPWGGQLVQKMLGRLQLALETLEDHMAVWNHHLPALLWVLFVGTTVTDDSTDGRGIFFIPRLDLVCQTVCRNQVDFEQHMRSMVWDGMFGKDVIHRYWNEGMTWHIHDTENSGPRPALGVGREIRMH